MSERHKPLYGLIPAAGRGTRARPYTKDVHKGLLDVNGVPNMERIIYIMRDDLNISTIIIVVGYLADTIRKYFGNGERYNVEIQYVHNDDIDKGLAWSIYLAKQKIDSYFCIMLCDECYLSSNHSELKNFPYEQAIFTCAGLGVDDDDLIRKNYSIEHEGTLLQSVHEKPVSLPNDIMGSGTFICSPAIFEEIEKAFVQTPNYVEFVSLLNTLLESGHKALYFQLKGTYVNINDRDSLALAKYHDRDLQFDKCKKVLIIYAEGDENSIAFTIKRYVDIAIFHFIYVVIPHDSILSEVILQTNAIPIVCPVGCILYGEKLRFALAQCSADILVITEADYSFSSQDVIKLFSYLRDADMVIGTRTTRQLIEQGSTMRGLVRFAHASLGKMIELLWWNREARFTDVGCTFRALWSSTLDIISADMHSTGPEFSAEMMIACLDARLRVIEIPVNYFNRSDSQIKAYRNPQTFFSFLRLIVNRRYKKIWNKP